VPDVVLGPVDGGSSKLAGYLAVPAGEGPWPAVIVVHEAFGVDAVMRRQVDRLAAAGYLALMPDLFSDGGAKRCLIGTFRAMFAGRGRAFTDIEASRQWLLGRSDCTGKVGVIGFCMGGGFALLSADRGYGAASVNYGQLPDDLDRTLEGACPIVASYGGRDRSLPGAAATLDEALDRAGVVERDVVEYPTAGHTFLNDRESGPRILRPLFRVAGVKPDPEAAADAWRRIEAFFGDHLR
jgi:carboxymethylenebutenolidase